MLVSACAYKHTDKLNKSRIQIAKSDIAAHFNRLPARVFKHDDLAKILAEQRAFWRLASATTVSKFIEFLIDDSELSLVEFDFPARAELCFVWGKVSTLEVLGHIKKNTYFSHYTAMSAHGLTEQTPTSFYLTAGRASPSASRNDLTQEGIDRAFAAAPRVTENICTLDDKRIYLLNGAHTKMLGVIAKDLTAEDGTKVRAKVTDLERTLIDAVVRPAYSGGVFEVAKAFANALDRVSVNKLAAMLGKLSFTYPFHQAIGFYLERAGYQAHQLELLRKPMEFDFYLTHNMGPSRYVKDWRLYVPQGF